ncbi:UDP-glycosyltransferase 73C4-like [Mangifera indica]|uniref:UDP-glycosyltransferase 73C4-like n=1 Tax=Mangifera indica TaxID=29780 RepID=UPI001CFBBB09|nr:UDP-glycosyltransferase 73C4-like [Mangifera indica]
MAPESQPYQVQPHFVLIPLMAQGHLLPAVDIAKLLAQRNAVVTIVTTPRNAARFSNITNRSVQAGLPINVVQIEFPATQVGLPDGCESADAVPSLDLFKNFFTAMRMMQEPVEKLFQELKPSPSCLISDRNFAWTADVSSKFQIPRILFDGTNCFSLFCSHNLHKSKIHETLSDSESFVIPGLSDQFTFRRSQLPGLFNPGSNKDFNKFREEVKAAEAGAYGVIVNSFEELETEFLKGFQSATGSKVWCIGPVSLCNKDDLDMAQRGNSEASTEVNPYLKWLNSWPANSVIYACLGSLSNLTPAQLIELGLGLEATNRPFIWVIRRGQHDITELNKWLEDGFEERVKGRGLLIRGWAPQVLILSHPSTGAFLTHCGWNSTLEGICAGVPMITWPLFAEQFFNEKLVVHVLKTGVPVGAEAVMHLKEEEKFGVQVKKEKISEAIEKVMNENNYEERRKEARKLAETAKKAVEEGGSSYRNITLLIEDIIQQQMSKREKVMMQEN